MALPQRFDGQNTGPKFVDNYSLLYQQPFLSSELNIQNPQPAMLQPWQDQPATRFIQTPCYESATDPGYGSLDFAECQPEQYGEQFYSPQALTLVPAFTAAVLAMNSQPTNVSYNVDYHQHALQSHMCQQQPLSVQLKQDGYGQFGFQDAMEDISGSTQESLETKILAKSESPASVSTHQSSMVASCASKMTSSPEQCNMQQAAPLLLSSCQQGFNDSENPNTTPEHFASQLPNSWSLFPGHFDGQQSTGLCLSSDLTADQAACMTLCEDPYLQDQSANISNFLDGKYAFQQAGTQIVTSAKPHPGDQDGTTMFSPERYVAHDTANAMYSPNQPGVHDAPDGFSPQSQFNYQRSMESTKQEPDERSVNLAFSAGQHLTFEQNASLSASSVQCPSGQQYSPMQLNPCESQQHAHATLANELVTYGPYTCVVVRDDVPASIAARLEIPETCSQFTVLCNRKYDGGKDVDRYKQYQSTENIISVTRQQMLQLCIFTVLRAASLTGAEFSTLLDSTVYRGNLLTKRCGLVSQRSVPPNTKVFPFFWDVAKDWKALRPKSDAYYSLSDEHGGKFTLDELQEAVRILTSRPPRRINNYAAPQFESACDDELASATTCEWTQCPPEKMHLPSSEMRQLRSLPKVNSGDGVTYLASDVRNLYKPVYVVGQGVNKSGWCSNCEDGRFYKIKNSGYLYHKNHEHGIFANGRVFEDPLLIRRKSRSQGSWEGLCGICYRYIDLDSRSSVGWSTWFRHYNLCTKEYDDLKRTLLRTGAPVEFIEIDYAPYGDLALL